MHRYLTKRIKRELCPNFLYYVLLVNMCIADDKILSTFNIICGVNFDKLFLAWYIYLFRGYMF